MNEFVFNSWETKEPMITPRNCVVDGKIYAIGGNYSDSNTDTVNEVYDSVENSYWGKKRKAN